jgi:predicted small secreted protein
MRKLMLSIGLAATVLTISACATVKGVGRDIESVGEAGQDAID